MNLLISSITNAQQEVLSAHLKTVQWQHLPDGWSIDHFYLVDPSAPQETMDALEDAAVPWDFAGDKPENAVHNITSQSHGWSTETFYWLAREKQRLLDKAKNEGYDAIWLIDSDLLLAPDTLQSLLAAEKPVTSAVFWTKWQPDAPPLPQVWMRHPYEFNGKGWQAHEFLEALSERHLLRVGGLGACTVIRAGALAGVRFWPLIEGLPSSGMWQGEDRHFCVHAQRNHVELWADAWPDIFHCYRPEDVERIEDIMAVFDNTAEISPALGDLVSLTLEPLEEPALADMKRHVRGRLGTLPVLPDIAAEVAEMHPGEERLIRVRFPLWHEIEQYRGQDRLLRLRLLSAKPFRYAPTLHDASMATDRSVFSVRESAMDEPVPLG